MIRPGTRIADRYTVVRPLGTGGMGRVYEVRSEGNPPRLALKLIRNQFAGHETVRARLQREGLIQGQLDHPGIVKVFDIVEHRGSTALVMEYVDGRNLRSLLLEGRPRVELVEQVAVRVFEALLAAHEADVVHRDLKPDNIFVVHEPGGGVHCKLIDFGIAKVLSEQETGRRKTRGDIKAQRSITRIGAFVGTYNYASPEQVVQGARVDVRSDLYSMGVVLWEMLAGVQPYGHLGSPEDVMVAVCNDPLPVLPDDVPSLLMNLVQELTRKKPEERPQSALEVLQTLRGSGPSAQRVPGGVGRPPRKSTAVRSQGLSVRPGVLRQARPPLDPPPAMLPEVHLSVSGGTYGGRKYLLSKKRVQLGADSGIAANDYAFDIPTVSGQHAELYLYPSGDVWVIDLDSANGTTVNGERLAPGERKNVMHGGQVGLGPDLIFRIEGSASSVPLRSPGPSASSTESGAVLTWTPPGASERRCSFDDRCDIGRDPTNRIILESSRVSRRHVLLEVTSEGLLLVNLSSSKPVLFNGSESIEPGGTVYLDVGDRLRIIDQEFEVRSLRLAPDSLICVNDTCRREVNASLEDCPWCGTSLAFAHTTHPN